MCRRHVEEGLEILVESAVVFVAEQKGDLAYVLRRFGQEKDRAAEHDGAAQPRECEAGSLGDTAPHRDWIHLKVGGDAFLGNL